MTINLRKVEPFSSAASSKLGASGITETEARALGIYSCSDASTINAGFKTAPALVIPYFTAEGRPMLSKQKSAFYRIRYLGDHGWAEVGEKKPQRYTQPINTGVAAYLPLCQTWSALVKDPNEPLLITEGEFKAAKACLSGYPTIGLGGVYNFRSIQDGHFLLPELEAFNWMHRSITIVYDSDYKGNGKICSAINRLGEELSERGADVKVATVPDVYNDGRKTGLDDLLVAEGDATLTDILKRAEPIGLGRHLWGMNEEVCYIRNPGLIVSTKTRQKIAPAAFTGHSDWSAEAAPELKVKPDGNISYVKGNAAKVWINWPMRRAVEQITYRPGQGMFCEENGYDAYNEWSGWGCEPKKGDIKPWADLCSYLFQGADKGFIDWFLDWCAYPLQNPGKKMFSAVVVHGRATGTGKTLLGYTLGKIYGRNFTKIENKNLKREFNGWAECRQFILGDEISGSDKRADADAFKTVITQEEIWINTKGIPEYMIPDCINYYFTSNHPDAFFIEDEDRRYAVHEVLHAAPLPDAFYKTYEDWKEGPGPSALFFALLQRDLSNFNPKAHAFKTAARARMSLHGKSDLGIWCSELRELPESILRVGQLRHQRDLFTSQQLLELYRQTGDPNGKVTANGLARALATAGFAQVLKGAPIPYTDGTGTKRQGRFYAIRNQDRWLGEQKMRPITDNIKLNPARLTNDA